MGVLERDIVWREASVGEEGGEEEIPDAIFVVWIPTAKRSPNTGKRRENA